MSSNSREAILAAAKRTAQARGYNGLNFRDLADEVGIRAASIHYHFATKADLGAAVARRYWEDTAAQLEAMLADAPDPAACLKQYPGMFRKALGNGNGDVPGRGVASDHHGPTAEQGRACCQAGTAGRLTRALSLTGAIVSSVM